VRFPRSAVGPDFDRTEAAEPASLILLTAFFNSFVADWEVRQRVTAHLDMHFVYKMRIPRLTPAERAFGPIVEGAARLICTTAEFDAFAKDVGLKSHKEGVIEALARGRLRAELDGLVAHLLGRRRSSRIYSPRSRLSPTPSRSRPTTPTAT